MLQQLTEDGVFALFFRPHPWEFGIKGKKNANAWGSAGGGGGWGGVLCAPGSD